MRNASTALAAESEVEGIAIEPASRRSQRYLAIFATSTLAGTLFALWISTDAAQRDALVRLPEPQRRALYERTLHALESVCDGRTRTDGLDDFVANRPGSSVIFPNAPQPARLCRSARSRAPSR